MHLGDSLSAFLDGELDSRARSEAESHLAACPPCRTEFEAVSESSRLLRSLPVVEPPASVLAPSNVRRLRPRRARALVGAAAAAALIVGVGFGVSADRAVPLQLDEVVEQHVARASVDPGFNVLQVQAVVDR